MITIKTANYDREALDIIRDALLKAYFEIKDKECEPRDNMDCSICPKRFVCKDLESTIDFLTKAILAKERKLR